MWTRGASIIEAYVMFIYYVEEESSREWHGETGFISKAMLLKFIDDPALPIYYLDGPPAMVNAMRKLLSEAGVDDDNIRTEEFSGY